MRTPLGCPPKISSAPVVTSVEKKCTCCLLHPTGSESSAWFSASPTSTSESHRIPLLVVDLIRMSVVDPPKISFQVHSASSPKNTDIKKKWNEWVKVMACNKNFLQTWNQAGIHDAILVTLVADIRIDQQTMEALFGFWCSATNTFIFPWGEAGFSVEDSHVLTALPVRGSYLDRKLTTEEEELRNRLIVEAEKIIMLSREAQRIGTVTCDIWLEWFTNEKDIDDELRHLGFLSYWLCMNVFPSLNPTLASFFGLAARLSLGDRIALAPAIVTNIYHDLNVITESITAMGKGDNGVGKNWKEKCKATLGDENIKNTIKKRKVGEIDKYQPVIKEEYSKELQPLSNTRLLNGSSDSFHEKLASNCGLPLAEDTGTTAVPSGGISGDKNHNIINIDSDDEVNHTAHDVPPMGFVQEDGANAIGKNEIALVKELEEFLRLDVMSYQEQSPEVEESKKILSLKCKKDPYGQEAIDCYPNFFRLIPQRPHYKGLLKGGKTVEEMKQHIFLGQWYMLVDLMREVLRTNVQTNAAAVEGMFLKAQILQKNGFDVRHLIARLKLVAEKTLRIWKD